jgi:arylsulfatase A-like enzyme
LSIVPLLRGKGRFKREAIFWHFPAYLEPYNEQQRPWRTTPAGAVRQGYWKLIEFFEDGKIELYNLKDDIGESKDLARVKSDKAKELHQLLIQWRQQLGAPVPIKPNPDYDPTKRESRKT